MALAICGKLPLRGDFVEAGLPAGLRPLLEAWLDGVLTEARAALGPEWEYRWADAPMLRFWLGGAIWGGAIWGQPLAGVMAASQDRVGRRFPLLLLAIGGGNLPAPAMAADQSWYEAAEAHLARLLALSRLEETSALLADAPEPAGSAETGAAVDFWAIREGADIAGLWAEVATVDHARASAGRSYWWVAGTNAEPVSPAQDAPAVAEGEANAELAMVTPADPDPADADPSDAEPPDPAPSPDGEASAPADPWLIEPADEASPFASDTALPTLFAPPEQAVAQADIAAPAPAAAPASELPARAPLSQLWAGPGLPSGQVIAWFLQGYRPHD